MIKIIWKINMLLKSSANRKRIRLFHIWTHFSLFLVRVRIRLQLIGGEISSKMGMVFLFHSRDSSFMQNNVYRRHRQTTNSSVLVLKRNIQNVAAGFALLTVVETGRFIASNLNTLFISTFCQYTSPIAARTLLSTHNSFSLYLVDWNETLINNCLLGTKLIVF